MKSCDAKFDDRINYDNDKMKVKIAIMINILRAVIMIRTVMMVIIITAILLLLLLLLL